MSTCSRRAGGRARQRQLPSSVRLEHVAKHGGDHAQDAHEAVGTRAHVRGEKGHRRGEEGPVEAHVPQHSGEEQRKDVRDHKKQPDRVHASETGAERRTAGSARAFSRLRLRQRGSGATETSFHDVALVRSRTRAGPNPKQLADNVAGQNQNQNPVARVVVALIDALARLRVHGAGHHGTA